MTRPSWRSTPRIEFQRMRLLSRGRRAIPAEVSRDEGSAQEASRLRQTGQVLALFVLSMVVLIGMVAVVVDISWFWSNSLRVQRAADAAALAGAIYLPGSPATAYSVARAEATKNGYTGGSGTTITPTQDPTQRAPTERAHQHAGQDVLRPDLRHEPDHGDRDRARRVHLARAHGQPAVVPRHLPADLQEQPGPVGNRRRQQGAGRIGFESARLAGLLERGADPRRAAIERRRVLPGEQRRIGPMPPTIRQGYATRSIFRSARPTGGSSYSTRPSARWATTPAARISARATTGSAPAASP